MIGADAGLEIVSGEGAGTVGASNCSSSSSGSSSSPLLVAGGGGGAPAVRGEGITGIGMEGVTVGGAGGAGVPMVDEVTPAGNDNLGVTVGMVEEGEYTITVVGTILMFRSTETRCLSGQ